MPLTAVRLAILAPLLATTSACSASGEDDLGCFSLGGGYEGEDLEALQAECEADSRGTYCDASAFIESDVAKCLWLGEWSEEIDRDLTARLFHSTGDRTVVWVVDFPDRLTAAYIHATTGKNLGTLSYQPE